MELKPITLKSGDQPVLLAVLAHPDDETFGTGGTLALYARRGVKVFLICATRGEVGEVDEEYMKGFKSIADRRVDELRCAAGLLGLTEVIFLDYRDSGMEGSPDNRHPEALTAQPVEAVAKTVAELIQKIRPQVLITFDPIGGYRHPDHIAIHKATVRAFDYPEMRNSKQVLQTIYPVQVILQHRSARAFKGRSQVDQTFWRRSA